MNVEKHKNRLLSYAHKQYAHYDWYKYALGYKTAALTLIDKAMSIEEERNVPNDLLYPIFFCFRHFVELLLKQIIAEYNELTGSRIKIPKSHKIENLFRIIVPIIQDVIFVKANNPKSRFKSNFTKYDSEKLQNVISMLNQYDSDGESFRFPIDCKGDITLKVNFQVPLDQLRETINTTFGSLNHISFTMTLLKLEES